MATLRPGATWIQMGTIGLAFTERYAVAVAEHEIEFVDAPVSGSDGAARARQLLVLASGDEAVRERVQPVFDALARGTLWLGPAGNGMKLKLAVNNFLVLMTEAVAEAIAFTDSLGLAPRLFEDAIAGGPLASPYAILKSQAMIREEFTRGFALRDALKDVRLALEAARDPDAQLPLTDVLLRDWESIAEQHGNDDLASVITRLPRRSSGDAGSTGKIAA